MILSGIKYIKLFIIKSICDCSRTLKSNSILIYHIYKFCKFLYDMSILKSRLMLRFFDCYWIVFLLPSWLIHISFRYPSPIWGLERVRSLTNSCQTQPALLKALLVCFFSALMLGGSFRKTLSFRDLNISIRKSVNDILLNFVYISITKLSVAFMSVFVTSPALFPKRMNISLTSERFCIQVSHPLHLPLE